MLAGGKSVAAHALLLISLFPVSVQATKESPGPAAEEIAQQKELQQYQIRESAGSTPEGSTGGEQRNTNHEQSVVQGDQVQQGPYGNKQYHKRKAVPDVVGGKAKPQRGGK